MATAGYGSYSGGGCVWSAEGAGEEQQRSRLSSASGSTSSVTTCCSHMSETINRLPPYAGLPLQGTAATAVAGVYGALRVQGKSNKELAQQRIVLVGAGSAGTGVARMLALGMVKQVWRPLATHCIRPVPQSFVG